MNTRFKTSKNSSLLQASELHLLVTKDYNYVLRVS